MQPIAIRKLTAADAHDWWHLRLEALQHDPQAFSSAAEDHRQTTIEATAARIASAAPGSFILGAFHGRANDGELIGVAGFHREQEPKSRHKGRVWGVYVTKAYRGRGVGRELMCSLIEQAKAKPGLEQIVLSVSTGQLAAKRVYESLGFQPFGRESRALLVDGKYLDEDYYILTLV